MMTRYLTATPEAGMAYVSPVTLLQEVSVIHSVLGASLSIRYLSVISVLTGIKSPICP